MKVTFIKTFAIAGLLGSAIASQAFSFATSEFGTFTSTTNEGITTEAGAFNVYLTQGTGYSFSTGILSYSFAGVPSSTPLAATGSITISGFNPADTLTFALTGSVFSGAANSDSFSGTAALTASTGIYSVVTKATGTAGNMNLVQGTNAGNPTGTSYGSLAVDVQAAPEPASFGIVGLGIVALVLRRRSA